MKKLSFLLLFIILFMVNASAQNIPRGMKYQAVARDLKGEVLSNAKIELRINLLSKADAIQSSHYSEIHSVVTNQLGLFTLVVGEGKMESGDFEKVPWSSADIWMEIQIKTNGQSDFTSISNSQLLAVPYAYYAATAGVLAGGILQGGTASKGAELPTCPCEGGLSQVKVLYLGPSNVTVKAYRNKYLTELLATFTGVNNGAILTVNANNYPDGKLKNETFFQVMSPGIAVVEIPTECEELKEPWEMSLGETFGNFSVLSHRDRKNNAECTVCDLKREWHVGGNGLMDLCNWLGTKSYTDLILITNNIERLKIGKDGDVEIKRSLSIGANLTVDSSVLLNRIAGSTLNHGALTVDGPTDLNNSLNVDGPTDLNSRLYVNNARPTKLTGTLQVDGITDLNAALNVNNLSPSLLTGTLQVNKDASFNEKIKILSEHQTDTSGLSPSGSLQVGGGVYIKRNLYIGGIAKFGGPAAFGGPVTITDVTESIDTITGALIVAGGVGIRKRLNVKGTGIFENLLRVKGMTTLENTNQSFGTASGALVVSGGAGIQQNVNIGGVLNVAGVTTLNNTLNVNSTADYAANFKTTGANGINIQIGVPVPHIANDFIVFRDSNGNMRGRIEGETDDVDLAANQSYQDELSFLDINIAAATADLVIAVLEEIQGGIKVVAAATSSTGCVGLGACFTAPIPSLIVESGSNLLLKTANFVRLGFVEAASIAERIIHEQHHKAEFGVTYQSGAADYAEWLPKKDIKESFKAGDVVYMTKGFISKTYEPAAKMMVISLNPIVLGNGIQDKDRMSYEKVAFMGQVPVKVLGKVKAGDYIIASPQNNGFGMAVHPENMLLSDYAKIVGVSWEDSENDTYSYVNTAVGLNTSEYAGLLAKQDEKIKAQAVELEELKNSISKTNATLSKLVPGFSEAMGIVNNNETVKVQVPKISQPSVLPNLVTPDASNIVYYKITDTQVEEMFAMAEGVFKKSGGDIAKDPFWGKIKSDPSYKIIISQKLKTNLEQAINMTKEVNK